MSECLHCSNCSVFAVGFKTIRSMNPVCLKQNGVHVASEVQTFPNQNPQIRCFVKMTC